MAKVALTMVGAYQSFDAPRPIQSSDAAERTTTTAGLIRPVPTRGRRSVMLPRRGSPRPRMTRTTMITRNGTASGYAGAVLRLEEVGAPVLGQRLRDAQEDAAHQRQRVGLEAAQESGGQPSDDEDAERDRREEARGGGRQQSARDGSQPTADRPGDAGEHVGGPAERRGGAGVLGGRRDRVAEAGAHAGDGEQKGHHRGDRRRGRSRSGPRRCHRGGGARRSGQATR